MESRYRVYFLILLFPAVAWGTVFQTVPEALHKVFPEKIEAEKKNAYLTADQIRSINSDLEFKMDEKSTLVTYFEYRDKGILKGTAYIDTDTVRHESETLMIVISDAGTIRDIEILQFNEPKEFFPPDLWKKQFENKGSNELYRSKAIVGITGATLTSRAISKSVQKVLAIHKLLHP